MERMKQMFNLLVFKMFLGAYGHAVDSYLVSRPLSPPLRHTTAPSQTSGLPAVRVGEAYRQDDGGGLQYVHPQRSEQEPAGGPPCPGEGVLCY